ncbi:MAG: flagellar basal-body MS-ring/collar protein FliF [Deltaproteobacteria bacterium]|nr:flagellar basal-body MS-ring/collar protein FliF [Deltaproteobacteria bacterium]
MKDIWAQFQSFFENLSLPNKIIFFTAIGVVVIGMVTLVYMANRETWVPLYSNINPEDAATVKEKLDANQIPVLVGPGGRAILVHSEDADNARLSLAKERVVMGGGLGFADLFVGNSGLGETEFQQQVKYRIALEGELARLIGKLSGIKSAKVTLALPKKSLFIDQEQKTTASVVVDPQSSQELTNKEVLTIAYLVANSVESLDKKNVVVVDTAGRLLSQGISDDSVAGRISEQIAHRRNVEMALQAKVIKQLESVVGSDRVKAEVSVDLAFDKETTKEEIYDPEGTVVRSEQVSTENSTGSRSIPVGIPGVTSNLPETQAGASEVANVSTLNRSNETRNYETSHKTVMREPSPGKINRLSVSVLVDGKYKPVTDPESGRIVTRKYEEWSTGEINSFNRLVKTAVGFNEARGDTIEVANLQFNKPLEEDLKREFEETTRNREFFLDILRYTFLGVGLLLLILFVIRPMVQKLSAKPEDLDLLMGLPATIGELEGEELEIPTPKELSGIPSREKIIEMARGDTLATASMIRNWLREKR